ncbi:MULTISPECIES: acyl-CoA thioester hydrolase/BAAT C-terminal domain-containing protein [unclassified Sphingopyxis]|jgi:hypothetical protein|nr:MULTISPECIES: acyl-CoA thioester hydrolase/BAAT C-terminal domain-containing protein [unclassified Sphingopyxis]USI76232.1 hypothetical protein KEC45_15865 [Sphingopyxis sp. USTB-05]
MTEQVRGMEQFGGAAEENAAARIDSWPKIVAFLNAELEPKRMPDDGRQ